MNGIWVGEWPDAHPVVVFDPAAQRPDGKVVTFFSVTQRDVFHLLPHVAPQRVRRLGDRQSHPDAVEAYETWLARKGSRRVATGETRRGSRSVSSSRPALPSRMDVRIPDEIFDSDWAAFCRIFPGAFESAKYLNEERSYKAGAHEALVDGLSPDTFASLEEGALVLRVRQGLAKTENLLSRFEHAAIHGALKEPGAARGRFLQSLRDLLWADDIPMEGRFAAWADALEALPQSGSKSSFTWPVATAMPYLTRPEAHCILKPRNAQAMTRRYGVDLGYRAQPDPVTYARWLCFVEALEGRLREKGARDRLDVQSFLWRIDPEKGPHL